MILILEGAHGAGPKYKKNMSVYSVMGFFHSAVKHITTAQGGMVITNNKKIFETIKNKSLWCR